MYCGKEISLKLAPTEAWKSELYITKQPTVLDLLFIQPKCKAW